MEISNSLKPLRIKRLPLHDGTRNEAIKRDEEDKTISITKVRRAEEPEEEAELLSPLARYFHTPSFNCCIIAFVGLKTRSDVSIVKNGLKLTLLKHPRFSSIVVMDDEKDGKPRWIPTQVDLDKHVFCPDLNPDMDMESADQFVEDYASDLTKTRLDLNKPLWELHILNIKTSEANAVGVFRIHHSIGDCHSLVSLLLSCARQPSNPESMTTIPKKKKRRHVHNSSDDGLIINRLLLTIWSVILRIVYTCIDILMFLATFLFLKDEETPIKGGPGVELTPKRLVHRIVSLNDIKLIKNGMNATINDVVLGAVQAGLTRYLSRKCATKHEITGQRTKRKEKLLEGIRLRGLIVFNIRASAPIQILDKMMKKWSIMGWGNGIGYVLLPLNVASQDNPLNYIRQAKAGMDRKKLSFEALWTYVTNRLLTTWFGNKAATAFKDRVFLNTTLLFSNAVGPEEEIACYGHPLAYVATTMYGQSYALTIHCQSYADRMAICLAADEVNILDPHRLCNDIVESLQLFKDAIKETRK